MEDFSEYCAAGVSFSTEMVPANDGISVRVIQFTPPKKNNNPAVLFVAGWVSLIDGWKHVLREMTRDFVVYYVETREKITSTATGKHEFGVENISGDLAPVILHYNLPEQNYVLFGSSLGATAILDVCHLLPRAPRCLLLIGPNAVFRTPRWGLILVKMVPPAFVLAMMPIVKWYLRTFRLNIEEDYAQYEKYCNALDSADPWKLKKGLLTLSKYQIWPLLSKIKIPTLIVGASKDTLHDPDNLHKMVELMPRASYLDLETNFKTHQAEVVVAFRNYLEEIKHC